MKVSVVVCAYSMNRYGDVCDAVRSILDQTYDNIEIIIVVDGNLSLFEQLQSKFSDQEVVTVRCNEENMGLSYSRTQGVELASGSVVAFLDDDAIAHPDWIEQLVRGYKETDAIAVGGRMIAKWIAGRPPYLPEEFNWLIGVNYEHRLDNWTEVRNTLGSNMSFRREVFEETGGFDEQMALTDLDLDSPTDEESTFLKHLAFSSVPNRVSKFISQPSLAKLQQLLLLLVLTSCVGLGYAYGAITYWIDSVVN